MNPFPGSSSSGKFLASDFSPAGLHVLVVDDDPLCVMVLERMLKQCSYKVTTCTRVDRALQLLREDQDNFDIVMTDVYMPNEDGFKLLEVIGLELDLPVIMMSGNSETNVVLKGITHGACDYLIKPVRIEELKNIWQHVLRKKGKVYHPKAADLKGEVYDSERTGESQDQLPKKRKEQAMVDVLDYSVDDVSSLKKARVNWSIQLHRQFVNAVNQLGVEKAVPKRILEIMNVQGLTRENVASHLQKYRLYLKRLSGVVPEPYPIASFQALGDGSMGGTMLVQPGGKGEPAAAPVNVKGLNLGAGVGSGASRVRKIDPGTMESLAQFKTHQQKQAANRAQVLGALGVADQRRPSSNGLHRMMSLDLSCFLQAQHDSPPKGSYSAGRGGKQPFDDFRRSNMRSVKREEGLTELQRGEGPATLEWNIEEDERIQHFILASSEGASKPNSMRMLAVAEAEKEAEAEAEVEDEDNGDEDINDGDDDAVSSSANVVLEQALPGSSAHEQLSGSSMSPDACSFVALDDLGPPLIPPYMDNTELDITDYLQLDKGGFTYQH